MNFLLNQKPTESELEILQILWEFGPSSVRFVHDKLLSTKDVGYTTTLKIMQLMVEKNIATRDTTNRSHIYAAAITQADTQKHLLSTFLDKTFKGSAAKLVLQALGDHDASDSELEEIKNLITKLEDKSNELDK